MARRGYTLGSSLNKRALLDQIIAELTRELEGYARSARAAHAEATDEQSKAENKYDTRGLEASYLARGQALQVAETGEALKQFRSLEPREFAPGEPIEVGALVELEQKHERTFYFVGPRAGGMELLQDGKSVLVITPQSPLGQQLMGKKQGGRVELKSRSGAEISKIVAVR